LHNRSSTLFLPGEKTRLKQGNYNLRFSFVFPPGTNYTREMIKYLPCHFLHHFLFHVILSWLHATDETYRGVSEDMQLYFQLTFVSIIIWTTDDDCYCYISQLTSFSHTRLFVALHWVFCNSFLVLHMPTTR